MRINRISAFELAFYPSLFNPGALVSLLFCFLWIFLISWWQPRKTKITHRELRRTLLEYFIASTVNVWWWDRKLALTYAEYIACKGIPYFQKGTYEYLSNVAGRYKRYRMLRDKRVIY